MSEPKRFLHPREIVEQKLTEASMWMVVCLDGATERRHPRQADFLRRWVDLQQRLGAIQTDLGLLASEQRGAGFDQ